MKTLAVGDQIYNHGDMANPSHFGKVIAIREDARFGDEYEIRPDDEEINLYTITAASISPEYKGTGLTRIVLKSAYMAWREKMNQLIKNPESFQPDNTATGHMIRLQAAAPELLEACKYAAQWYSDNISIMPAAFQTVVNELEAAIAKAEVQQ